MARVRATWMDIMTSAELLADWRQRALQLQNAINQAVIGQEDPVAKITVALFARGHVMLEGDVGVGKTTLLRAVARTLGGAYERIEGTIDLMPNDLIYHTYIGEDGKPRVDPGPLLKHGEALSIFFFNEVNRARPQVHSLLLRVMAERSVSAFNRTYAFPYLQVFADRNRVEKEETFEMPSAARDRFLMELRIELPEDPELRMALMFDPRFHQVDALIAQLPEAVVPYREIATLAPQIQTSIQASPALQTYALELWQATRRPQDYGVRLDGVDMDELVLAGASARGMSMLLRAARVHAWLDDRDYLIPEDIQALFHEVIGHRIFLTPVYELQREQLVPRLTQAILAQIAAP
ncbi:MoxR-like ATPase [Methylomarinovum tepidoasis]|uniref:MoxR-like ATPase n=2 Tax=Methylomarinovum tepidoasis TaxID=2840183 RepID=A0AAU9C682_9GAMM|nr:MoxR-like ATPase [Methylomarinovum sp. IN45]